MRYWWWREATELPGAGQKAMTLDGSGRSTLLAAGAALAVLALETGALSSLLDVPDHAEARAVGLEGEASGAGVAQLGGSLPPKRTGPTAERTGEVVAAGLEATTVRRPGADAVAGAPPGLDARRQRVAERAERRTRSTRLRGDKGTGLARAPPG